MKTKIAPILVMLLLVLTHSVFTQTKKPNSVIFAVVNDGKSLEPLAKVENGKLMQTISGGDDATILTAFHKTYYAPKKSYNLIFGGAKAGTVAVIKSDPKVECSSTYAQISYAAPKVKLKGFVMALATDISNKTPGSGLRRVPTAAERAGIEKLVSAEFAKQKIAAKALRYQNLTVLDVNNDKMLEFVGSYWVATSATERALLFFIAEQGKSGKYSFGFSEFRKVKKDEVMSGEITALDSGIYHELLLDSLDYNDDGSAEIFTMIQGFEGSTFSAYELKAGKWTKALESSNYHCGY